MVTDTGFTMTSKHLLTAISDRAKPFTNLLLGRLASATFQVTLRCHSACGYCDLPPIRARRIMPFPNQNDTGVRQAVIGCRRIVPITRPSSRLQVEQSKQV